LQTALISCNGALFDEYGACPQCGGELSGYDVKKKQFAVIKEGDQQRKVCVLVKRFRCRQCCQICSADQPFYPDTRIGSPVVDLCVTLSETMPYSRVSSCLADMGIIVDRWSVRNYVRKNRCSVPSAEMFGVRIPLSIVSLSTLSVGKPEGVRIDTGALLAACFYPSRISLPHEVVVDKDSPPAEGGK